MAISILHLKDGNGIVVLSAGGHVYVEKPFSVDLAEADEVLAAAAAANRLVCVGHDQLFDPCWADFQARCRRGDLGRVVVAEGGPTLAGQLDQFLFGIAKNRVIDHYRKHKVTLVPSKADEQSDRSQIWLENMAHAGTAQPKEKVVNSEDGRRQRQVLVQILRDLVVELWSAGEQMVLTWSPDHSFAVVDQPSSAASEPEASSAPAPTADPATADPVPAAAGGTITTDDPIH